MTKTFIIKSPAGDIDLVETLGGLGPTNYCNEFAPFRYTHIRGFYELFDTLLIESHFKTPEMAIEYIKAARFLIMPRLPSAWRSALTKNSHWDVCNADQIERICQREPARLDRACQAILALEIAFALAQNEKIKSINIYKFIRLVPAMSKIEGLSKQEKGWLSGGSSGDTSAALRYTKLVEDLAPQDGRSTERDRYGKAKTFLSDVADGYALSHTNAEIILDHLRETQSNARIVTLRKRTDAARTKNPEDGETGLRCCRFESEFVRLKKEAFQALSNEQELARDWLKSERERRQKK